MTKTGVTLRRKGETLPDYDPNDKRTREEIKHDKKKEFKAKRRSIWSSLKWKDERRKVILEKIEHFKKTGNTRKLAIYESKL